MGEPTNTEVKRDWVVQTLPDGRQVICIDVGDRSPEEALALIAETRVELLKQLVRELVEWVESDGVRGAFTIAAVHGYGSSEPTDESRKVESLWERAREVARQAGWTPTK